MAEVVLETLHADVLVIGGGPAGAWAALSARERGAERVVLVDKGYCGTSGATASANTGVWAVTPEGDSRERSIARRLQNSRGLGRVETMASVLEQTWERLAQLAAWGYPFPTDDQGRPWREDLRGPDYMAFMRKRLRQAQVQVLDHSPALQLLVADGAVRGALGQRLQSDRPYRVEARAVVLASGGVAFLSKTLGCDVNTGDGLLMAAEAGAELSGMEFSAQYGICPAYSSVTKGLPYFWATFTDEVGQPIAPHPVRQIAVGRALLRGPVYAVLDRANADVQRWLRVGQPNCFLPHDRLGIDPFTQRFPITLRSEGTVRGTGGVRILDRHGKTGVPGLYAAGDAASRETLVGAATGGGAPNAAWAMSSGTWAGHAAADFARRQTGSVPESQAAGAVGLRNDSPLPAAQVISQVQAEALPLDKNLFRSQPRILASLTQLDALWSLAHEGLGGVGRARVRAREAAALLSAARFAYRSALARSESRGLHQRTDAEAEDPAQAHSLAARGPDQVEVRTYVYREGASA
ncbi:MAG: FAD-binding protein [Polyangiales bacterium]